MCEYLPGSLQRRIEKVFPIIAMALKSQLQFFLKILCNNLSKDYRTTWLKTDVTIDFWFVNEINCHNHNVF